MVFRHHGRDPFELQLLSGCDVRLVKARRPAKHFTPDAGIRKLSPRQTEAPTLRQGHGDAGPGTSRMRTPTLRLASDAQTFQIRLQQRVETRRQFHRDLRLRHKGDALPNQPRVGPTAEPLKNQRDRRTIRRCPTQPANHGAPAKIQRSLEFPHLPLPHAKDLPPDLDPAEKNIRQSLDLLHRGAVRHDFLVEDQPLAGVGVGCLKLPDEILPEETRRIEPLHALGAEFIEGATQTEQAVAEKKTRGGQSLIVRVIGLLETNPPRIGRFCRL